ncbi:MAG: heparinase II/III domain-containing protein [Candidatus Anammoxibacter sp.]
MKIIKFIRSDKESVNFLRFSIVELSWETISFVAQRFWIAALRKIKSNLVWYPKDVLDSVKYVINPTELQWKLLDDKTSEIDYKEEDEPTPDTIKLAGVELSVGDSIDWEMEFADEEDYSSLHRLDWILLAVSRYDREGKGNIRGWGTKFINDWFKQNFSKDNRLVWDSYTVSERICDCVIFFFLTRSAPSEIVSKGLSNSVVYLKDHLEYHGRFTGNHVFNNGRAIYLAGCAFGVKEWQRFGELIILREINNLVTDDGFLREGSSHYHFLFTRWVLEIIFFARLTGQEVFVGKLSADVKKLIARCWFFLVYDRNRNDWDIPLFGDISPDFSPDWLISLPCSHLANSFHASVKPDSLPKARGWSDLFGGCLSHNQDKENCSVSIKEKQVFKTSGWYRLDFKNSILMFRAEPESTPRHSGHAHCDVGSYCLYIDGSPLLVDVGRLDYKGDGWGDFGVSSMAHNTVCIDGLGPSPVKWLKYPSCYSQSPVNVLINDTNDGFEVEIHFKGFMRLREPIEFKRNFTLRENELKIVDSFFGHGNHYIESFLHFDSKINLEKSLSSNDYKFSGEFCNGTISFGAENSDLTIDHFNGSDRFLGWNIKKYGEKLPASTLRVSSQSNFPAKFYSYLKINR